jgi:hypothetical protein
MIIIVSVLCVGLYLYGGFRVNRHLSRWHRIAILELAAADDPRL